MASARSTVSIARTTPAQKPRGEQSTSLRSGLAAVGAISGPNHPSPAARERSVLGRTWGCFWALSRHFSRPLRARPRTAYIEGNPVIADDQRLRLPKRWAKRKRDLPGELP